MKLFFVLAAFMMPMPAKSHSAEELLDPVYDAALAGDGVKAIAALSKLDATALDPTEAARASCMQKALLSPLSPSLLQEVLLPISDNILRACRLYWQQSMMQTITTNEAETQLKNRIDELLAAQTPAYLPSNT